MVFTSFVFLFIFLPISLCAYYLTKDSKKHFILLIVSLIFYGYWRLDFLLLIFASIIIDFYCGQKIYNSKNKKLFLSFSILLNLGVLFYFKYFNFGLDNLNGFLSYFKIANIEMAKVILPVGVSFFTFQTMSYSIDIYRGEIKPAKSLLKFATFVSMFPQLVAGPIVRYSEIQNQLINFSRKHIHFQDGLILFILGFNKKVLIANNVAPIADYAFKVGGVDAQSAFIGAIAYTIQIYFDFSGYSDMAIGLGKMLGFEFPQNFKSPYKAVSITDFWNRWHVTLSRWFKDYLYIPLGGNRNGPVRTYSNLFIVMFLCGLWHGAAWTFIIWGTFHGLFLILERINGRKSLGYARFPKFLQVFITFIITVFGWIPFRAENFDHLIQYLSAFAVKAHDLPRSAIFSVFDLEKQILFAIALMIIFVFKNAKQLENSKYFFWTKIFNLLIFIPAIHELINQDYNPFLYFNF